MEHGMCPSPGLVPRCPPGHWKQQSELYWRWMRGQCDNKGPESIHTSCPLPAPSRSFTGLAFTAGPQVQASGQCSPSPSEGWRWALLEPRAWAFAPALPPHLPVHPHPPPGLPSCLRGLPCPAGHGHKQPSAPGATGIPGSGTQSLLRGT